VEKECSEYQWYNRYELIIDQFIIDLTNKAGRLEDLHTYPITAVIQAALTM